MALPAGWYPVAGDPTGTQRYWDGDEFISTPKKDVNARRRAGFVKPHAVTKWRLANPLSRLIAAVIDYGAPIVIVVGIANGMGIAIPDTTVASWTVEPRLVGAILASYLVNQVILVGLFGVSLGRILLGLKVVDSQSRDDPPGLARALVRFLLLGPGLPFSALFIVLGRRQGLHDLGAGTAVVYV